MADATCSIAGCERREKRTRGWCLKHYRRWCRHGDPEYAPPPKPKAICSIEGCTGIVRARGWCGKHYQRWANNGAPHRRQVERGAPNEVRFWAKVDVRGPDECWSWLGGKTYGYGRFRLASGRQVIAPRYAYESGTGEDPGELHVCHRCDNPPCVNPAHLFLGTHEDNMHDMIRKGRAAWQADR